MEELSCSTLVPPLPNLPLAGPLALWQPGADMIASDDQFFLTRAAAVEKWRPELEFL